MWLYATGMYSNPIFLYEYQSSRAKKHPKEFLKGFNGFLQTDGYPGYNAVENATTFRTNAEEGLKFCDKLFKLEKEYRKEKQVLPYKILIKRDFPL